MQQKLISDDNDIQKFTKKYVKSKSAFVFQLTHSDDNDKISS